MVEPNPFFFFFEAQLTLRTFSRLIRLTVSRLFSVSCRLTGLLSVKLLTFPYKLRRILSDSCILMQVIDIWPLDVKSKDIMSEIKYRWCVHRISLYILASFGNIGSLSYVIHVF